MVLVVIGIANGGNSGPTGTISGPATTTVDDTGQSASETGNASQRIPFGRTFTYQDGVGVGIGQPVPYMPSGSAFMPPGSAQAVAMKVTVANGSGKPLDLVAVRIQAAANDQAVEQVIDSAKGIMGIATQTLPPGIRQTYTVVFGVPAGHSDFRVQVEPGWFSYDPVFFTGKI